METLTTKEKVQIALDRLDDGIRDFFQGDHYKEYLATMSKLHHYSARNCILIEHQCPGASIVASYNSWKNNFNRQVKKGEKSDCKLNQHGLLYRNSKECFLIALIWC